jgi:hypothetical protein
MQNAKEKTGLESDLTPPVHISSMMCRGTRVSLEDAMSGWENPDS